MAEVTAEPRAKDFRFWELLAFAAYALGLVGIALYAGSEGKFDQRVFTVLGIVGTASWLAGTALGFLFGVPRVRAGEVSVEKGSPTSIIPNTNLEQISDWLTKIIVGATLVQLGPIAEAVGRLSTLVGSSLGGVERVSEGAVVSGGVLVFFFVAGFIWGYLWCSLLVFREMQWLVQRERGALSGEAKH